MTSGVVEVLRLAWRRSVDRALDYRTGHPCASRLQPLADSPIQKPKKRSDVRGRCRAGAGGRLYGQQMLTAARTCSVVDVGAGMVIAEPPESGGRPQERLRGSSAPGPAPCANNPKRTPEAEDPRQHLQWGRKQWTTPELLAVRVPPTLLECLENLRKRAQKATDDILMKRYQTTASRQTG